MQNGFAFDHARSDLATSGHPVAPMKRTFTHWFLFVGAFALSTSLFNSSAAAAPVVATDRHNLAIPATDEGLPGEGPIRRYDWFQKLWIERRAGWAARVQQDQNALVFLGDSITQGWGDVG